MIHVSSKLEVSVSFLFRVNVRHWPYTDRRRDGQDATLYPAYIETGIIMDAYAHNSDKYCLLLFCIRDIACGPLMSRGCKLSRDYTEKRTVSIWR